MKCLSTRRSLLLSSLVSLACAERAFIENSDYESGALGPSPAQSFQSTGFQPVQWNVVNEGDSTASKQDSSGMIFMAPRGTSVAQPGGVISNQDGTMVWSASDFGESMTFHKVTYKNKDHLLLWTGEFSLSGYGFGHNLLLNQSYDVVANFTTVNLDGVLSDFHDIVITNKNTAIMTAYVTASRDLSPFQGPNPGFILGGVFQEIDIASGKEIFTWNSLDHVDPSEGFASPGVSGTSEEPWDYFHINSIDKDSSGNYLISARHTHTLYYVDGSSGNILWRIGGTLNNFTIGDGAWFSWQHDARWHGNNRISVFDNAASDFAVNGPTARGLILNVDTSNMTVSLAQQMLPFVQNVSTSQGNVQLLDNGNVQIGWGSRPYFSEYDSNGNMLNAVHFGVGDVQSYRVYLQSWTGRPRTTPSLGFSLGVGSDITEVGASWNGATEIASWELFGSTADSPQEGISLNTTSKTDFETAITYSGSTQYTYFQVAAKNAQGQYLAFSDFQSKDGNRVAAAANQTADAPPLDGESPPPSSSGNANGAAALRPAVFLSAVVGVGVGLWS
ncbi:hypothetical protein VNI00_011018 [Paramarasmius palmivorus]|uniref:ASST-domain-containing protein n=1 Tax=Paramarasmius palmivorus TaxID=297713 RepID=A0AAW0CEJ1_9AGAR